LALERRSVNHFFSSFSLTSEFGSGSQHIPKTGSTKRQGEDGEDGNSKTVGDTEAAAAAIRRIV